MTIVYRTNTWLHRKKRLCCQSDSRVAKLSTIYILVWPPPFPKCFDVIACTWNQLRRTTLSRIASNQDKSSWPNASSSTSAIPEVTRASYPEETGQSETTCPRRLSFFCGHFLEHAKMLCFLWWTCVLSRSRKLSLHCWCVRRFWYGFDGLCVCVCTSYPPPCFRNLVSESLALPSCFWPRGPVEALQSSAQGPEGHWDIIANTFICPVLCRQKAWYLKACQRERER